MLKNSYYQGETAGKLALEVLAGTPVSDIPVVLKSPNQYMFDYTQLVVRGISPRALPQGSIIINEPETFYYRYKRLIWTITAVVLGLIGFIVILLFNIKKRIRAQKGLQTIINATSSIVDYNSLENFRQELATQLTQLLPVSRDMLLFNHGEPEDDQVDIRFPSPASNADESLFKDMPETAAQIILDALKQEKCTIQRKSEMAFFKSRHLPGNLILLKGKRGMDDLDKDLLEIFASNLAMSIDNIEKHKIEKSLETARQIQMSMLPKHFSSFSEKNQVDLAGINGSAEPYGYNRAQNVTGIFEHKLLRAVKEAIMVLESKKDVPSPTPSLAYVLDPSPSLTRGRDNIDTYPWHPVAYKGSVIARDYPDWQAIVQKLGSQVDYLIVANYRKLHTAGPDSPYADPREAMAWTEKHSKAPVIGINSFNVEDGAMISIGVSPFEQGETAAAMAQEILTRNIRAGQIPMKQNSQYIVAMRESSLQLRSLALPAIYEAFGRATENYIEK